MLERISDGLQRPGPLFFSQVREDPSLEIQFLSPRPEKKYVLIGSGGCTALSLLAHGAKEVVAADSNPSQGSLIELKAFAIAKLNPTEVREFLGAWPCSSKKRLSLFSSILPFLSNESQTYWTKNKKKIAAGVLNQGVTEKFLKFLAFILKIFIHPKSRMDQLLSLQTLEEQKSFYFQKWNNWRWKFFFKILLNRWVFNKTYHPQFFKNVKNPSFSNHFHQLFEKSLLNNPVSSNYFLHFILTGQYAKSGNESLPYYLSDDGIAAIKNNISNLKIVDAPLTKYLMTCPPNSIDGLGLSNILEWITPQEIESLLSEIERTTTSDGKVAIRNFVGWTEIPPTFLEKFSANESLGEKLMNHERSLMQYRIIPFTKKNPMDNNPTNANTKITIRQSIESDNQSLIDLTAACTMEGDIGLRIDRSPDFFALNRLEGETWNVGVAENVEKKIIGCGAFAEKKVYFNGTPSTIHYTYDLKVHPLHRQQGVADLLTHYLKQLSFDYSPNKNKLIPILLTILAGNKRMEKRSKIRGLPELTQIAKMTIYSVMFMWKKSEKYKNHFDIRPATTNDIDEMLALWNDVAPGRQFSSVLTKEDFSKWLKSAPGLKIENYSLVRSKSGQLLGFAALWDQAIFKNTVVTRYSTQLKIFRFFYNLFSPLIGSTPLPIPGEKMNFLSAVHLCFAPNQVEALRAFLIYSHNFYRKKNYAFFSVGLDATDPLTKAFDGLMPQTMYVNAYLSESSGTYSGPPLNEIPLHFEIALV